MKKTDVKKSPTIRCAIYTRKSTEEGLQQEFNTLDAQRESAEAYIASQKNEGWQCLPDRYDDGGYTGGNLDRPAVTRLMKDIEAGKIDCVVVYKVDRLSRSLLDFARMMQTFDNHKVSFVSVTQHFNTTNSMGRLTLNILLSFAQFEREIISERTRDKIAAARRKGKFAGGRPILGYDIVSSDTGSKLVVNEDEAAQVRAIFEMYLKHEALVPTATELNRRGWTTKRWVTSKNTTVGGRPFDKNNLFQMLTNVVYVGKVRYREEIHTGQHAAIIDDQLWQRVQARLQHNGRAGGALVRNRYGALLKGLLHCGPCRCSMGHTYTAKGRKRYRYYVCLRAQKRGWQECPSKSIPAGEIEAFVVDQIKCIGRDPKILAETLHRMRAHAETSIRELKTEQRVIERELRRHRTVDQEQRETLVREEIERIGAGTATAAQVQTALSAFVPVWDTLSPREQARVIRLLIERVDYDGTQGTISLTFRPTGIKALAQEAQEAAA